MTDTDTLIERLHEWARQLVGISTAQRIPEGVSVEAALLREAADALAALTRERDEAQRELRVAVDERDVASRDSEAALALAPLACKWREDKRAAEAALAQAREALTKIEKRFVGSEVQKQDERDTAEHGANLASFAQGLAEAYADGREIARAPLAGEEA